MGARERRRRRECGSCPPSAFAAPWVALLLVWPWFAVNASREASVQRFTEMRADFATFPRAYATEELAKYFRDRGDLERSFRSTRRASRPIPTTRGRGSCSGRNYLALERVEEAQRQFDEALRLDPKNALALEHEGQACAPRREVRAALELYRSAGADAADRSGDRGRGSGTPRSGREAQEAGEAFRRAAGLRNDPEYDYYAGLSIAASGRWDEGIELLRRSTRGDSDAFYEYGLAMALEGRERPPGAPAGVAPAIEDIHAAREAAARAVKRAPSDERIASYKDPHRSGRCGP